MAVTRIYEFILTLPNAAVYAGCSVVSLSTVPKLSRARLVLQLRTGLQLLPLLYVGQQISPSPSFCGPKKNKVAYEDMTAKIAINRPELHNAFRPITVNEMRRAMDLAQDDRCGCLLCVSFVQQQRCSCSCSCSLLVPYIIHVYFKYIVKKQTVPSAIPPFLASSVGCNSESRVYPGLTRWAGEKYTTTRGGAAVFFSVRRGNVSACVGGPSRVSEVGNSPIRCEDQVSGLEGTFLCWSSGLVMGLRSQRSGVCDAKSVHF